MTGLNRSVLKKPNPLELLMFFLIQGESFCKERGGRGCPEHNGKLILFRCFIRFHISERNSGGRRVRFEEGQL